MTRVQPLPGTVTRETAIRILRREGIINSPAMLLKLKGIKRVIPAGRTYGFYEQEPLLKIINDRRELKGIPPLESLFDEEHKIEFRQATLEDVYGSYNVAVKLFGPTTPVTERIPIFEKCPIGNVVVVDNDEVVAFGVILPMKQEPLMEFLAGKFRGSQIAVNHLDPFESGKVVDILIKSVGSYNDHLPIKKQYSRRLLSGLKDEVTRWGHQGYILHKIYCTSEEPDGIALALEMRMQSLGRIPGSRGKRRYALELNPYQSPSPMIRGYNQAIEAWRESHPQEYAEAWRKWKEQH